MKLVVALFLTSAATGVSAREFRAADTQDEDYPTVHALGYMGSLVAERSGGRHRIKVLPAMSQKAWFSLSPDEQDIFHEAALAGIYARGPRNSAITRLIERIRKVE